MSVPLAVIEDIIDASGVAPAIEAMLPAGVRGRQLPVRTLLAGMMLTAADGRPAHLTRVRQALLALPEADQARLGVTASWKTGPHHLTYRQTEHTFRLMAGALAKDEPDGVPAPALQAACDQLLEAKHPRRRQERQPGAGRGLDRHGELVPAPPPRQHRMRRPRGLLGPPQLQPQRPQRRDVLRLLPVRRHDGRRGERPARPRAGTAHDLVLVRPRPRPRPRPRAAANARRRHPAGRPAGRLRLLPPPPRRLGHPAPPGRRRADPGPAPARPRPPRHPPGRGHHQRQPLLPQDAASPAAPHPAAARRRTRRHRRPRPADRRTSPAQARPGTPPTTPTATTASPAPPPRARSAARCGRNR